MGLQSVFLAMEERVKGGNKRRFGFTGAVWISYLKEYTTYRMVITTCEDADISTKHAQGLNPKNISELIIKIKYFI